jgi:hypothetical protein
MGKLRDFFTEKIVERFVGISTALLVYLLYSYVSSLATNARVDGLESKVDRILSGLCIIEEKTCSLKDK